MVSKLALGAIWGYQQYISPRKGFRCAYSVHHGGTGCSGYAKHAIREHGLWQAIPFIRQRLRDCKAAYADIKANCTCRDETQDETQDRPLDEDERAELERRRKNDKWYNKCDCCGGAACDCASLPAGCGSGLGNCGGTGARTAAGNKACDINPCDGDIGIGGCDCASCDCGGCSCG